MAKFLDEMLTALSRCFDFSSSFVTFALVTVCSIYLCIYPY